MSVVTTAGRTAIAGRWPRGFTTSARSRRALDDPLAQYRQLSSEANLGATARERFSRFDPAFGNEFDVRTISADQSVAWAMDNVV